MAECSGWHIGTDLAQSSDTQNKLQPLKMLGKLLGPKGPGAMLLQSGTRGQERLTHSASAKVTFDGADEKKVLLHQVQ